MRIKLSKFSRDRLIDQWAYYAGNVFSERRYRGLFEMSDYKLIKECIKSYGKSIVRFHLENKNV